MKLRHAIIAAVFLAATPASAQQAQPMPPATDFAVKLPATKWQVVMNALGKRPAEEVFDLVVDIQQQIVAAQKQAATPSATKEPPKVPTAE